MKYTYENEGAITFLVCELEEEDVIDELSMGMLRNNQLKGILPIAFVQIDEKRYLKWNISSKVDLDSYLRGKIGRKKLLNVFLSICEAFSYIDEYFLDNSQFLLDRKYMYCMVSTGSTSLIYLPLVQESKDIKLKDVLLDILYHVDFLESEDSNYVPILMNQLRKPEDLSPQVLMEFLGNLQNQPESRPNPTTGYNTQTRMPMRTNESNIDVPNNQSVRQNGPNYSYRDTSSNSGIRVGTNETRNQVPFNSNQNSLQWNMNGGNINNNSQNVNQNNGMMQAVMQQNAMALQTAQSQRKEMTYQHAEEQQEKKGFFSFGRKKKSEEKKDKTEKRNGIFNSRNGDAVNSTATPLVSYGGMKIPGQDGVNKDIRTEYIPGKGQVQQNTNIATQVGMNKMSYAQQPSEQHNVYSQDMHQSRYGYQADNLSTGTRILTPDMVDNNTTILTPGIVNSGEQQVYVPTATLRRIKNNQTMQIKKDVLHIGREITYADFVIGDNGAISKSHADIICRDKKYFLKDTNSLNHTYLNGEMLTSNIEYELRSGDSILIANEEFEFRVK